MEAQKWSLDRQMRERKDAQGVLGCPSLWNFNHGHVGFRIFLLKLFIANLKNLLFWGSSNKLMLLQGLQETLGRVWQCLYFWLPMWFPYPQLHISWPWNHRVLSQWQVECEPPTVPGSILWWTTPCGKCITREWPPPLWWYSLLLLFGWLQPGW